MVLCLEELKSDNGKFVDSYFLYSAVLDDISIIMLFHFYLQILMRKNSCFSQKTGPISLIVVASFKSVIQHICFL